MAHHGQFANAGARLLRQGAGAGLLPLGGSYLTYVAADGNWTLVIEKIDNRDEKENATHYVPATIANETARFRVQGQLLSTALARRGGHLAVWRTCYRPTR